MRSRFFILGSIVALTLLLLGNSALVFADNFFSDVPDESPYHTAISTLKERSIIQGYPDGLFRPNQTVTRAEILKIAIEGAGIDTAVFVSGTTGFTDVADTHSLKRYIAYAAETGIVNGYGDGTYGPENTVTRGEAAKILLRVNTVSPERPTASPFTDVPLSLDLAPYITYVHDRNLLETGTAVYAINTGMTRGDVAEMMYRLLTIREQELERFPEIHDNVAPIDGTINATFYADIVLDTPLPRTFVESEVLTMRGSVTNTTEDVVSIFLTSHTTNEQTVFVGALLTDNTFSIPVTFHTAGTYDLGMIPGEYGASRIMSIAIVPDPHSTGTLATDAPRPSDLRVSLEDNQTVFEWTTNGASLSRITLRQGNKTVERIIAGSSTHWDASYQAFHEFAPGVVSWSVAGARSPSSMGYDRTTEWSESAVATFTASNHYFSSIDTDSITIRDGAWHSDTVRSIPFHITAHVPLSSTIFFITPDGEVEEFPVASGDEISAGKSVSFSIPFTRSGTYIVEINNRDNLAVVNAPVYIGSSIPLIPDFRDMEEGTITVRHPALTDDQRDTMRKNLLKGINNARRDHGREAVELSSTLSALAQSHADDMVRDRYFSHYSPDGEGPQDRAARYGIAVPVGENLASTGSLTSAHEGLLRSAVHRRNMFDEHWAIVGIGLAVDSGGNLIVVQEFSVRDLIADPLTAAEQDALKVSLLTAIESLRAQEDRDYLMRNLDREARLEEWLSEDPSGALEDAIPIVKDGRRVSLWGLVGYYYPDMALELMGENPSVATEDAWTQISIGTAVVNQRLRVVIAFVE